MGNLAIIPARGGSKRIPNKNFRIFSGHPIIRYSIETALTCGLFEEVMVSTDTSEIEQLAISFGATVPFKRTSVNSDDSATLSSVVFEVLESYQKIGQNFEFVCMILPTAPLLSAHTVVAAYEKLVKNISFSSVVPVVRFSFPIQRAFVLDDQGKARMLQPETMFARSQDLEPAFHDAGQFYWLRVADFFKEKSIFTDSMGAIEISELEAQDIDTEVDWELAELKFNLRKTKHDFRSSAQM